MALLKDDDREEIGKAFEALVGPVRLLLFTEKGEKGESEPSQITRELLEELCEASPKLTLERKDLAADADQAKSYGVDKSPAIVLLGAKDHGIRYYGVPAGHEFSGFIENLIEVSTGEHGLPESILEEVAKVDQPVKLEVLFTPS